MEQIEKKIINDKNHYYIINNYIYYDKYKIKYLNNYYLILEKEYKKLSKYYLYLYSVNIIEKETKSWLDWLHFENN